MEGKIKPLAQKIFLKKKLDKGGKGGYLHEDGLCIGPQRQSWSGWATAASGWGIMFEPATPTSYPTKEAIVELVAGIDESGRGAAIGSMFMALVQIPLDDPFYTALNFKDSKKVGRPKRERIAAYLCMTQRVSIEEATPHEIDGANINDIELSMVTKLIHNVYPRLSMDDTLHVYIDGWTNTDEQRDAVIRHLKGIFPRQYHFIFENKADEKYLPTRAASLIAKTARDTSVRILKEKYDIDFGWGYSAEEKVVECLKLLYTGDKELDEKQKEFKKLHIREKWATIKKLIKDSLIEKENDS